VKPTNVTKVLLDKCVTFIYNIANWHIIGVLIRMIIKTRVFEMADGKYQNLSDLAKAMGLSVSQIYRVREGKRGINQKFIVGAKRAFPDHRLDDLFYFPS
jgi:D-Tyr-tRNAtyr deacylase